MRTKPAPEQAVCLDELPRKPYSRLIEFQKAPGQDFGASLVRLGDRFFVTAVMPGSLAWRLGLGPGDQVTEINDKPLHRGQSARCVFEMLNLMGDGEVLVVDRPLYTTCTLEQKGCGSVGLVYLDGQVQDVVPHSASHRAKVPRGTTIVGIDGEDVLGLSDAQVNLRLAKCLAFGGKADVTLVPRSLASELAYARLRTGRAVA